MSRRIAAVFAVLILLATAAFVVGVSIERSSGHSETTSEHTESGESSEAHEGGEADELAEGGPAEGAEGNAEESHADESETIAGIDVESTPIVAAGVLLSLALAGAALRWPRREVFAAAAIFCAAFAVLDGRELIHQLDEEAGDVATFAALALLLHLAAAGAAILGLTRGRVAPPPPVAA